MATLSKKTIPKLQNNTKALAKSDKKKRKKRSGDKQDDEEGERRSVITGKKIKLHIEKTDDDLKQEQARKQLLEFMNSSAR